MDRHMAWLIAQGENIFLPEHPKTAAAGYAIVILVVIILALTGTVIYD
ncbi:MAG: hypothetical protein UW28_C0003G0007 [Parcubacteria group bacterium GW2011_GWA2_44_13]|nr:MAG: hypothetical protein UW28_C0003G0007 [Parcubacteria group bacterium GW2011_GWA2_44_13]